MDRRRFLQSAGLVGAAAAVPSWLLSASEASIWLPGPVSPVRVSGVVRARGRGLAKVGVSDGRRTVETAADGTFTLVSTSDRARVWVSMPAGYRIPVSAVGTARVFSPIAADRQGEATVRFDLEPLPHSDARHTVLVLGDVQVQTAEEAAYLHAQAVPDLIETRRVLGDVETIGIALGDMMYDHLELNPEWERAVQRFGVPCFQAPGNHDHDRAEQLDEAATRTFEDHYGPRYFSFDRGAVHYVVLDDAFWHGSGYIGYLDAGQLAWLASDLARIERGRTVVVCMHIPTLGTYHLRHDKSEPDPAEALCNREALYRLLEPYRVHVLSGHMHECEHLFGGNRHEHVAGAVCGAWWSGPICGDGAPNGYAVYEISDEDVRWRYKATGQPASHQIRVHPRGADPTVPEAVIANVWDWDPAWKVVWYEDGERRGLAVRRRGTDPLSVQLHKGPDLPAGRGWADPYTTDHLFAVPAASATSRITIEATDRFGRVYTAQTG